MSANERLKGVCLCVYRRYQSQTQGMLTKRGQKRLRWDKGEPSGRVPTVTSQWPWALCAVWPLALSQSASWMEGRACQDDGWGLKTIRNSHRFRIKNTPCSPNRSDHASAICVSCELRDLVVFSSRPTWHEGMWQLKHQHWNGPDAT